MTIQNFILLTLVTGTLALLSGCDVPSKQLSNEDLVNIWSEMQITTTTDSQVEVRLLTKEPELGYVIPIPSIAIGGGDSLIVKAGGLIQPMEKVQEDNKLYYRTKIQNYSQDTTFELKIKRPSGDVLELLSAQLPKDFYFLMPVTDDHFALGSTIPVTWSSTDTEHPLDLNLTGHCYDLQGDSVFFVDSFYMTNHSGIENFDTSRWLEKMNLRSNIDRSRSCPVTISGSRETYDYTKKGRWNAYSIKEIDVLLDFLPD